MTGKRVLFTGGTGFIGKRLIARLFETCGPERIYLLTEPKFQREALDLRERHPKLEILVGDITQRSLGIDPPPLIDWVFHLAALYDLAAPKALAERINIEGTRNVVELCEAVGARILYFSTCYVCGDREGTILESELEKGQKFKNHYEWSKYEAEREVRKMRDRAIIIRPSIVVGDSKTGETAKFDGPYVAMPSILRLKRFPGGVPVPNGGASHVNLVPIDYVVEAVAKIAAQGEKNCGKTYQIADPSPKTADELHALFTRLVSGREPGIRIPNALFVFLAKMGLLGIPKSTLPYFDCDSRFDTEETQRAIGAEIKCPAIGEYAEHLVKFWLSRQRSESTEI